MNSISILLVYGIFLSLHQNFISSTVAGITAEELKYELAKADANHRHSRGKSYRHRRSEEDENLRRKYGISSNWGKRRRAPVKNLVSEEDLQTFFDDWLPRRSTLPPSLSVTRHQQSLRRPTATSPSSLSDKKRHEHKIEKRKDIKRPRESRITVRKSLDSVDDEAVRVLLSILEKEAVSIRKTVIKRKIAETKKAIKKLEQLKKNRLEKQSRAFSAESEEFAEWLGRSIEDQEVQRQSRDQHLVLNRVPPKPIMRPIPRVRSGGQIFIAKRKGEGLTGAPHSTERTQVTSSTFLLETTTSPLNIDPKKAEVRKWRKPNPLRPPTVRNFPRPMAFASLTAVDGEFQRNASRRMKSFPRFPRIKNEIIDRGGIPPPYPFSHCYLNKDNLMCCNRFLESLMRKSYQKIKRSAKTRSSALQEIAARMQKDAEQVFNTTFEAIVSYDDYALRAHFAGDLMCKIDQDGKYVTIYATAMPYRQGSSADPLLTITPIALDAEENYNELRSTRAVTFKRLPYHELSREDVENERLFSKDISN